MIGDAKKLIVMTDIHITDEGDKIIGLDPLERFCLARDAALDRHSDADAMILMGDLTHHGRVSQYERLVPALADIPMPVIKMIGNHDRREAFLEVFPKVPVTSDGHVQQVVDLPTHRIITLDTLDGPPYPQWHHAGMLGPQRLAWLKDTLEGVDGRIPLVFAHHPPFDTGIIGMDYIKLKDGEDLLALLAQYPNAHFFCGHVHRTISGSLNGVAWSMLKSTCHHGPLELEKIDPTLSLDEPGSYGLALLTENGVIFHSEDVGIGSDVQSDLASMAKA